MADFNYGLRSKNDGKYGVLPQRPGHFTVDSGLQELNNKPVSVFFGMDFYLDILLLYFTSTKISSASFMSPSFNFISVIRRQVPLVGVSSHLKMI